MCRTLRNSTYDDSCGDRNSSALPSRPIRAVRPTLCTNAAGSCGASNWTTQSTPGMSKPLAATSVHSKHPPAPDANRASACSRCDCFILPCNATTSTPSPGDAGAPSHMAVAK